MEQQPLCGYINLTSHPLHFVQHQYAAFIYNSFDLFELRIKSCKWTEITSTESEDSILSSLNLTALTLSYQHPFIRLTDKATKNDLFVHENSGTRSSSPYLSLFTRRSVLQRLTLKDVQGNAYKDIYELSTRIHCIQMLRRELLIVDNN